MAVPPDSIWEFPGMYSLMMQPYGHRNDFFFCHYLGFLTIIFLEFKAVEQYKLAFASVVLLCTISFWLIITRGQYSIDIMAGVVFGNYFFTIWEKFSWLLDFEWFKEPFHLRHPNFQSKCAKCLDPINQWAISGSEQSLSYERELSEKSKLFGLDRLQQKKSEGNKLADEIDIMI